MRYHVGDILSVLSGRNLSPTGMAGILDLVHAIAGDEAGANLVRASEYAASQLRQRFPELAAIPIPADLNDWTTDIWVAAMASIYGEWHPLADGASGTPRDSLTA